MGADAVLLIVEDIGSVSEVEELQALALSLGMDALTEIRGEHDLAMAAEAGAYMIAVNQRDNPKDTRFTVDHHKAVRMAGLLAELGPGVVTVAASGIETPNGTKLADLGRGRLRRSADRGSPCAERRARATLCGPCSKRCRNKSFSRRLHTCDLGLGNHQ